MSSQPAETRTVHFARLKSSFCFRKINKFDRDFFWQVFNNYWTSLSKIWWFVSGEQINYYYLLIDLRDTDKSRYFWISEFNNCFIIRSPSLFFNEYLREAKRSTIFHVRVIAKHTTQLDDTAHEQNVIRRQLFAGHVVNFWPMKRTKNLQGMIISLVCPLKVKYHLTFLLSHWS